MGKKDFRKYNTDLKLCRGIQNVSFDTGLERLKYSVLFLGNESQAKDATKMDLENLVVSGDRVGRELPKVDFNCLKG